MTKPMKKQERSLLSATELQSIRGGSFESTNGNFGFRIDGLSGGTPMNFEGGSSETTKK